MSRSKRKKPSVPRAKPATPPLPRDDALLWRAVTGEVEKLPGRGVRVPEAAPDAATERAGQEAPPEGGSAKPGTKRPGPAGQAAKPAAPPLVVGSFAGLDKRTADRLRRGKLPIDEALDLHGHYREDARRQLTGFVREQAGRGKRCLLVVTGKGARSAGGKGVLREAVPQWLGEPPLREHVLAVSHATQPDGGTGAFYVLLKRRRG